MPNKRSTVVAAAKDRGYILLAVASLPNDPHLLVVLARTDSNTPTPYVSWFFNKDTGSFVEGLYARTVAAGAVAYQRRVDRYNGTDLAHKNWPEA